MVRQELHRAADWGDSKPMPRIESDRIQRADARLAGAEMNAELVWEMGVKLVEAFFKKDGQRIIRALERAFWGSPIAGGLGAERWIILWAGGDWLAEWKAGDLQGNLAISELPPWKAIEVLYPSLAEVVGKPLGAARRFGGGVFYGGAWWEMGEEEALKLPELPRGDQPLWVDERLKERIERVFERGPFDLMVSDLPAIWAFGREAGRLILPMEEAVDLLAAGARAFSADRRGGVWGVLEVHLNGWEEGDLWNDLVVDEDVEMRSWLDELCFEEAPYLDELHISYQGDFREFWGIPFTVVSRSSPYLGEGIQVWINGEPTWETWFNGWFKGFKGPSATEWIDRLRMRG